MNQKPENRGSILRKLIIFFVLITIPLAANADVLLKGVIQAHKSGVSSVGFSPSGKYIITGSYDTTIKIWKPDKKKPEKVIRYGGFVEHADYSPDGKFIAASGRDKKIKVFLDSNNRLMDVLTGHKDTVFSFSFTPDSNYLASGSSRKLKIWQVKGWKEKRSIKHDLFWARVVKFSPDGSRLITAGGPVLLLWKVKESPLWQKLIGIGSLSVKAIRVNKHRPYIYSVDFSPDSQYYAAAGEDGGINVWRVKDGMKLWSTGPGESAVWDICFSPGNKFLATAGKNGKVKLYDTETGSPVYDIPAHEDEVFSVAFSPCGKYMVTGCKNGIIKLWEVPHASARFNTIMLVSFAAAGLIIMNILIFVIIRKFSRTSVSRWKP